MYPYMNVENAANFAGKAATEKTKAELGAAKFGGDQTEPISYETTPYKPSPPKRG